MHIEHIGPATLYLGDCLDVLPTLPKVDAVITDPPYGLDRNGWDDSARAVCLDEWCTAWMGVADQAAFTFSAKPHDLATAMAACNRAGTLWRILVWHKRFVLAGNLANFKWHWEPILWFGSKSSPPGRPFVVPDVFDVMPVATRMHPESVDHNSQKPIELMRRLVDAIGPRSIADPFMGSGTTGIAALHLGRSFVGIERDPKYFDIACRRIEQACAQGQLFEPVASPEYAQGELSLEHVA